ncbi:MAG: hypothetical protein GY866_14785 [Proteobacteria bacterium]|nr:hypothetical protein [Pseudomonadota bacterium]
MLSFRSGPRWQKDPMATAMQMMANKQVDVKQLITATIPLDEVQKGFDSVYSGDNIAVLLQP